MKKFLLILLCPLLSFGSPVYLALGTHGKPFTSEQGISLGVKKFFYEDISKDYIGASIAGVGLHYSKEVMISFSALNFAPTPNYNFGVDLIAPIDNISRSSISLGVSLNIKMIDI